MRKAPPALALWLLRHLYRGANREELTGDLLEQFCEGRSAAWMWRQVLVALVVGAKEEARFQLPAIVCALAGTVWICLLAGPVARSSGMIQIWMWKRWVHSALLSIEMALLALPVLAAVLLWNRAFGWRRILAGLAMTSVLFALGDLATLRWVSAYPVLPHSQAAMLMVAGVGRVFLTLLISAWVACRPFRSSNC